VPPPDVQGDDAVGARALQLLRNVTGFAGNGRVCGVVGPSGSGKTTFLSALLAGTTNRAADAFPASATNTTVKTSAATANRRDHTEDDARDRRRGGTGDLIRSGQVWIYRDDGDADRRQKQAIATIATASDTTRRIEEDGAHAALQHVEPLHHSQVAYLQQQDEFFDLLTVEETLQTAAFLELPSATREERRRLVHTLIDQLGLRGVARCRVGNNARSRRRAHRMRPFTTATRGGRRQLRRSFETTADRLVPERLSAFGCRLADFVREIFAGSVATCQPTSRGCLSGGERRRLSVALELVTEKQLLLADEPTTGLDSSLSVQVVKLLRQLALTRNIPCIMSLHQPRSVIWNQLLDDCIVMAQGGRVCYAGPVQDAPEYLATVAGYPVPPSTNPAEFWIRLVSVDTENATQAVIDEARVQYLADMFTAYQQIQQQQQLQGPALTKFCESSVTAIVRNFGHDRAPVSKTLFSTSKRVAPRFGALLRRSWRQNIRNIHAVTAICALNCILTPFFLSLIWKKVRGPVMMNNSLSDRTVMLLFCATNFGLISYAKASELLAKERPVVRREQLRRQYGPAEYLLAKVCSGLPLDVAYASVFTASLYAFSRLNTPWPKFAAVLVLMSLASSSIGYAVGSWMPTSFGVGGDNQLQAMLAGIPFVVLLVLVGTINPAGIDPTTSKPKLVRALKLFSPFSACIEALLVSEYQGVRVHKVSVVQARREGLGGTEYVRSGDQVLQALGIGNVRFSSALKRLALLTTWYLFVALIGLQRQTASCPRLPQ